MSVLVSIANYNFSANADFLKKNFSIFFDTLLIDSSSETKPDLVDFVILNEFYSGLWNKSVDLAINNNSDWLFFVASDVEIKDFNNTCQRIDFVMKDDTIGVWSPSVTENSRCSFNFMFNQKSQAMRNVPYVEGFCFLCRTCLLKLMYPTPIDQNIYGWTLDILMCNIAKFNNYQVVVDDSVCIFHPKSKFVIDNAKALQDGKAYKIKKLKQMGME